MRLPFISALLIACFTIAISPTVLAQNKIKAAPTDTIIPSPDTSITAPPLPAADTDQVRQNISSGLDYLLRQQEENRRKQKRNAMLRIGFGVAMLVVLIIGLLRKRKV
jgi:hypothetical protein